MQAGNNEWFFEPLKEAPMTFKLICLLFILFPIGAAYAVPENLILNGGFEQGNGKTATGWSAYEQGYNLDSSVRHSGKVSIRCVNSQLIDRSGAEWYIKLDQKVPAPLLVQGWSKAEDVSGQPNSDYSLYIDLHYMDGTPLYGQISPFQTGSHDWQKRQVLIVPSRPLRDALVYVLFRQHTGSVWFDDVSARTLSGAGIFDSQPIGPLPLPANQSAGWFVHDVSSGGNLIWLADQNGNPITSSGNSPLKLVDLPHGNRWSIARPTLVNDSNRPVAVTLYYVQRFDGAGVEWWNDIHRKYLAGNTGERMNLTQLGAGVTGSQSLYPFGCVTGTKKGLAIGMTPDSGPRVMRAGYNAAHKVMFIAFDLMLDPLNLANRDAKGHAMAHVSVWRDYPSSEWGFRQALQDWMSLSPPPRAGVGGLWSPFVSVAKIDHPEDFHFAFHEGDESIASDHALGVKAFRYIEPMTWWMAMPKEMPRTYDEGLKLARKLADGPENEYLTKYARALLASGAEDQQGRFQVQFEDAPWTNGAVWTLNPSPNLPGAITKAKLEYPAGWLARQHHENPQAKLDGIYLDSMEGWASVLDYRPDALKYSISPLTFDPVEHQAIDPIWFGVYDFAKFIQEDMKPVGGLLMANSVLWKIHAFAPLLDVLGTEVNWMSDGKYTPESDAIMCMRRSLSYHKPYILLQNTDFNHFNHQDVEKYMRRCLFYGIYPSMFSADAASNNYWTMPQWYNRDRDLFRKYVPAIQNLCRQGWEPVTNAHTNNPDVYVERWGKSTYTLLNTSDRAVDVRLILENKMNNKKVLEQSRLKSLVDDFPDILRSSMSPDSFSLHIGPSEVRVVQVE
jgi:hypothetical protein